jgi:hypothetical protein
MEERGAERERERESQDNEMEDKANGKILSMFIDK